MQTSAILDYWIKMSMLTGYYYNGIVFTLNQQNSETQALFGIQDSLY